MIDSLALLPGGKGARTVGEFAALAAAETESYLDDLDGAEDDEELDDEELDNENAAAEQSLSALDRLAGAAHGLRADEVFALRARMVSDGEMPRWARSMLPPRALLQQAPIWVTVRGACEGPREPGGWPRVVMLPVNDATLVEGELVRAEGVLDVAAAGGPVLLASDVEVLRTSPPRSLRHAVVRAARGRVAVGLRLVERPSTLVSRFDVVTAPGDGEDILISQVIDSYADRGSQEATRAAFFHEGGPPPSLFTLRHDASAAPPVTSKLAAAKHKTRSAAWGCVTLFGSGPAHDRRIVSTAALREDEVEIHVEDEMRVALVAGGALRWLRSGAHELPEGAALILAWNEAVTGPAEAQRRAAAGGVEALARWVDRRSPPRRRQLRRRAGEAQGPRVPLHVPVRQALGDAGALGLRGRPHVPDLRGGGPPLRDGRRGRFADAELVRIVGARRARHLVRAGSTEVASAPFTSPRRRLARRHGAAGWLARRDRAPSDRRPGGRRSPRGS